MRLRGEMRPEMRALCARDSEVGKSTRERIVRVMFGAEDLGSNLQMLQEDARDSSESSNNGSMYW